jgi:hypothetical protein
MEISRSGNLPLQALLMAVFSWSEIGRPYVTISRSLALS